MFFMYVQFMLSFDHSVMDWLNSELNHTFWDTTTGFTVRRSPASQPHPFMLRVRDCLNFDLERARSVILLKMKRE